MLLGLIVLIIGLAVMLFFNEPEIFVDKEVEVIVALGIGLLILILHRRADSKFHRVIHNQHELIDEIHRKLHEQHELIKRMDKANARYILELSWILLIICHPFKELTLDNADCGTSCLERREFSKFAIIL